jgi:branched-chain amino acid aminotransferase
MTTIWIDGRLDGDARVSVLDHGLLYGDGVFEGLRMENRRVFRLDDHMRRFAFGMRSIGLELPGGIERARQAVLETCRAHEARDAYLRLVVTRGVGALGVDPTGCVNPVLFCLAGSIALYPVDKLTLGLDLVTASLRKPGPDQLDPRVKSLNYLNSVLAKREAKMRHADEALVLNTRGTIAEASAANIFVVRDGVVSTPPTSDGALEGITRKSVLAIAESLGMKTSVASLVRADVFDADECFLTGTGARIVAVGSLDGARIGAAQRPVMDAIAARFPDFVAQNSAAVD